MGGQGSVGGKQRRDWTCKNCINRRKGKALLKWGSSLKCHGCRLHKKDVLGTAAEHAEPSKKAEGSKHPKGKFEKLLEAAQKELADLKKERGSGKPPSWQEAAGISESMGTDDSDAGKIDAKIKRRLRDLAMLKGSDSGLALDNKEKAYQELRTLHVEMEAELERLQQLLPTAPAARAPATAVAQELVPGLGLTMGELSQLVATQLGAHSGEEQTLPHAAQAKLAEGLSRCITARWEPDELEESELREMARFAKPDDDAAKVRELAKAMAMGGTVGGVVILAKASILMMAPPLPDSPVLHEGRMSAAHVHWGVRGGLVMTSVYLVDSVGFSVVNQGIWFTLLRYPVQLNAAGYDWVVGGGFNMALELLEPQWGELDYASTIDYFFVSGNLGQRIFEPTVHELGTAAPRLPVQLRLVGQDMKIPVRVPVTPRPIPAAPPIGCARGEEEWTKTLAKVLQVKEAYADKKRGGPAQDSVRGRCVKAPQGIRYPDESNDRVQQLLVQAWDAVLDTVEQELLDGYDTVGEQRHKYVGRSGDLATALRPAKWRPPAHRARLGPLAGACRVAARWARQMMGASAFVAESLRLLQASDAVCELSSMQYSKLACFLLETKSSRDKVARHHKIIALLPQWAQDVFLAGMHVLLRHNFIHVAGDIVEHASTGAADRAHRAAETRALQLVLPKWTERDRIASPVSACDKEMKEWVNIWRCRELGQLQRPRDTDQWEPLPTLAVGMLQAAALSFPTSTAIGPARIGMRALVRLSKASFSKAWLSVHPSADIWGMGGDKSSPDSAFNLNIETEISAALGEYTLTVLIEARELGMPLRIVWMLLELYRQPRRLCAFGSISHDVVAWQGALAGCTHACAMVSLLLHRLLQRIRGLGVVPKALIDDVALRMADFGAPALDKLWAAVTRFREGARELGISIQREMSGYVTPSSAVAQRCRRHGGARGLKGRHWVGNLGKDLCGRRKVHRQTAERTKAPAARTGRLLLFKKALGRRVACLWKTGPLPSATHGAGVSGVIDATLGKLRSEAGMLVRARQGPSSVTVFLATQGATEFDPIYGATCDLVCRYASWAWEQRTSLAWAEATAVLVAHPCWAGVRGPIASAILTLWRIGWFMHSS
ncbi:unnamed protein product, partial [Prorocentrum cordatum]